MCSWVARSSANRGCPGTTSPPIAPYVFVLDERILRQWMLSNLDRANIYVPA